MKFTSTILSLAALFSVASALPTPSSTTTTTSATVVYSSTFDTTTSIDSTTSVDSTTSISDSTTFVGFVSPDSPWNSGSCMQIALEETNVYLSITEEETTESNVIQVSSDFLTQFLQVSTEQIEQIQSVTISASVLEVDETFCVS
jgi:hypothetical protein